MRAVESQSSPVAGAAAEIFKRVTPFHQKKLPDRSTASLAVPTQINIAHVRCSDRPARMSSHGAHARSDRTDGSLAASESRRRRSDDASSDEGAGVLSQGAGIRNLRQRSDGDEYDMSPSDSHQFSLAHSSVHPSLSYVSSVSHARLSARHSRMSHAGNLFTGTQASQPSAQQASSLRPQEVAEPIVASRLSKSLSLDNLDPRKRSHALLTLQSVRDLRPAQQFYEQEFGIDAPTELEGETIGYLDVRYKPSRMPEQRRFALGGRSIFGLPSPQRSAASYGMYVDGDLMASEPVSYMYVCHDHGIDVPLLNRHLASEASREADLATIGAMSPGIKKPRSFAKAYVSMITHDGHWKPQARLIDPSDLSKGKRKNAAAKLYDEYGVDWSVSPPQFLIDLSDELTEASEKIVRLGVHRPIIQALRAIDPAKANRTASALHFVLAVYEYRFLDRCLEKARRMGIVSVCDCLDGFLFLKHTFPPSLSIAEAFDKMTRFACDKTGMRGQIREKPIILPLLPSLTSRAFVDLEALRNGGEVFEDLGESGMPQIMERMDRHFVFIYARSSQPVV